MRVGIRVRVWVRVSGRKEDQTARIVQGSVIGWHPTINVTSENVTSENVTSENVTSENVTSEKVMSENVTSENVTSET